MNETKRILHLLLMVVFLALTAGVLLSSCNPRGTADIQTVTKRLSELQEHPFPPYSEGEFSIKSPLIREKWLVMIWSDGAYKIRVEYKDNDRQGDYTVIDYTKGRSLTYYHANNTYTITNIGESQGNLPMGEILLSVRKALSSGSVKYDGVFRVAGEKAYKFEVDYKKIDPSSGFDKTSFWVDTHHWTLLGLETESAETTMKWQARKVDFAAHPGGKLFTLTPPPGATEIQPAWQKGTHSIELENMKKVLGHDPLLPRWLPKGYKMVEVRTGTGDSPSAGILYRRKSLLGVKDLTIEEIALRGKEGPLGIEDCKNEKVQVHGKKAMYSKCKIGSALMWDEGGLQIMISGFESKSTMLKIAESMR